MPDLSGSTHKPKGRPHSWVTGWAPANCLSRVRTTLLGFIGDITSPFNLKTRIIMAGDQASSIRGRRWGLGELNSRPPPHQALFQLQDHHLGDNIAFLQKLEQVNKKTTVPSTIQNSTLAKILNRV